MLTISTAQPFAAVSRDANSIDIVAVGTDSQMYHKMYDELGWQDWTSLGGNFAYEAPALVASSPTRLDLFGRDKTTKHLMRIACVGSTWETEWQSSEELQYDRRFAAVSRAVGRVDVFGTAGDRMYHRALTNGSWSDVDQRDWYAPFQSNLALTSWSEGHLDIFGVGNDSRMWQKTYDSATGGWTLPPLDWQEPSQISNGSANTDGDFASDPAVVAWPSRQLHLFVVGSRGDRNDSTLYRMYSDGSWADYQDIDGTLTSPMAASSWGEGRLDVVGHGLDMDIWHRAFDSKDGDWQPLWKRLGGEPFGSSPVIVSRGPNRLDVLAIAQSDSSFYHISGDGNTWGTWEYIGWLPNKAKVTPFASGNAWSATMSDGTTSWDSNTTSSSTSTPKHKQDVGSGAVAGIAIGACAAFAIVAVAVFLLWKRAQKTKRNNAGPHALHPGDMTEVSAYRADETMIHEVQGNRMKHMPMSHAVADNSGLHELDTEENASARARR